MGRDDKQSVVIRFLTSFRCHLHFWRLSPTPAERRSASSDRRESILSPKHASELRPAPGRFSAALQHDCEMLTLL